MKPTTLVLSYPEMVTLRIALIEEAHRCRKEYIETAYSQAIKDMLGKFKDSLDIMEVA